MGERGAKPLDASISRNIHTSILSPIGLSAIIHRQALWVPHSPQAPWPNRLQPCLGRSALCADAFPALLQMKRSITDQTYPKLAAGVCGQQASHDLKKPPLLFSAG